MANEAVTKVKIEGEKEFKQAIQNMTQASKTLASEMKSVTSAFNSETSAQAQAKAKSEVLTKQLENENNKLKLLKEQHQKVADAQGENSTAALKLKDSINKTETNINNLNKELSECNDDLDDTKTKGNSAAKSLNEVGDSAKDSSVDVSTLSDKLGNITKTIASISITGLTAVATGIASITKSAVEAYADTEQLIGGIETLFKTNADEVIENANNAYKTSGMSANDYMETVTSFSASLISSLGGDTAAAAKMADEAIVAMSDNSNKMGTDMETIVNAYKGFSKGSYNMLDNLKLGYGGTKTEMQRLIADAEKLDKTFKATTDSEGEYTLAFNEIVEAIQIVQDNMDITGTTAKEASTTISGSISSMKAAWENLISGLADPDADLGLLVSNMVESAKTALNNILPAVKTALKNIPKALKEAFPDQSKRINTIVQAIKKLETPIKSVVKVIGTLIDNINYVIAGVVGFVAVISTLRAALSVYSTVQAVSSGLSALGASAGIASKAFTVLNGVMNANVIGAVVTAIAALVAGFTVLYKVINKDVEQIKTLSDEEYELKERTDELRESQEELNEEYEKTVEEENSKASYYTGLLSKLDDYVDAQGKVKKGYEDEANVILNELNSAYGTEYKIVNGRIQNYKDLKDNIEELIKTEQREALASAQKEQFDASVKNREQALTDAKSTYADYIEFLSSADYDYVLQDLKWQEDIQEAYKSGDKDLYDQLSKDYGEWEILNSGKVKAAKETAESFETTLKTNNKNVQEILDDMVLQYALTAAAADENWTAYDDLLAGHTTAETELYMKKAENIALASDEEVAAYKKQKDDLQTQLNELLALKKTSGDDWTTANQQQLEKVQGQLDDMFNGTIEAQIAAEAEETGENIGTAYANGIDSASELQEDLDKRWTELTTDSAAEAGKKQGEAFSDNVDSDEDNGKGTSWFDTIKSNWENLWGSFSWTEALSGAWTSVKTWIDNFGTDVSAEWGNMDTSGAEAAGTAQSAAFSNGFLSEEQRSKIVNFILNLFSNTDTSSATDAGNNIGNAVIEGTSNGISDNEDKVSDATNDVIDMSVNSGKSYATQQFKNVGKQVDAGIASGITSYTNKQKVKTAVESVCNYAATTAKVTLEIHSPSRVFRDQIGKNITRGIAVGIIGETASVTRAIRTQANSLVNTYQSELNTIPASLTTQIKADSSGLDYNVNINNKNDTLENMTKALQGVQVVMDGERMGRFVTNTTTKAVYG